MRARALCGSPGTFAIKTGFYKHNRKVTISSCGNDTVNVNLISSDAGKELKREEYNLMHLGMITIGVKSMVRKHIGAKVMICIYDDRWQDPSRARFE